MAYTGKGQRINRTAVADIFGVSINTIDGWVKSGCPVIQRGARGVEWVFNSADVSRWLNGRAVDTANGGVALNEKELRIRRLAAETALSELELAKAKALVAPLEQVERMATRAFAEVRANIRNVPGRVVSMLIGETDERRFKEVLAGELDQALEALASADLVDDDEPEGEEDLDEDAE